MKIDIKSTWTVQHGIVWCGFYTPLIDMELPIERAKIRQKIAKKAEKLKWT